MFDNIYIIHFLLVVFLINDSIKSQGNIMQWFLQHNSLAVFEYYIKCKHTKFLSFLYISICLRRGRAR